MYKLRRAVSLYLNGSSDKHNPTLFIPAQKRIVNLLTAPLDASTEDTKSEQMDLPLPKDILIAELRTGKIVQTTIDNPPSQEYRMMMIFSHEYKQVYFSFFEADAYEALMLFHRNASVDMTACYDLILCEKWAVMKVQVGSGSELIFIDHSGDLKLTNISLAQGKILDVLVDAEDVPYAVVSMDGDTLVVSHLFRCENYFFSPEDGYLFSDQAIINHLVDEDGTPFVRISGEQVEAPHELTQQIIVVNPTAVIPTEHVIRRLRMKRTRVTKIK